VALSTLGRKTKAKKAVSFSKADLHQGFEVLNKFWERNLLPRDLERHYFLHWFVIYQGNIIQAAKGLQIHRNTIQGHFSQFGFSKKSVRLRHTWQKMIDSNKKASFETNFYQFYQKFVSSPKFSANENKILIGLWQTKFSFKSLMSHYLLWTVRSQKSREWVQKKLDYSERHRIRLLTSLLNSNTRDGFWLSPLKPKLHEIYSPRYQNILLKSKKG